MRAPLLRVSRSFSPETGAASAAQSHSLEAPSYPRFGLFYFSVSRFGVYTKARRARSAGQGRGVQALQTTRRRLIGRSAGWVVACCAWVGLVPVLAQEQYAVNAGTPMVYLANGADPGPLADWFAPTFDDSAWAAGTYGVGFQTGTGAENLIETAVPPATLSVYTRATFLIDDPAAAFNLFLGLDYDDGVIVWLNGSEIYRSPEMPVGAPNWDTLATPRESSNGLFPDFDDEIDVSAALPLLQPGPNILAVGVWNDTPTSSDLVVVPRLTINRADILARRPYLQMVGPDRATLRWRTTIPTTTRLIYGPEPLNLSFYTDPVPKTEHSATVTGLTPDTRYFYAVGNQNLIFVGGNDDYYFQTAPVPGTPKPTRLWISGDCGTGTPRAQTTRDQYYAYADDRHTDLWLLLGDNAYNDGTDEQYQEKFFDIFGEMMRTTPAMSTFGNHEGFTADSASQSGPYYDIFDNPTAGELGGMPSGTEAYYAFDWANIHFVVLNSDDIDRSPDGAMLTWLEADLAATTQDWIIAYWHHPPYSKGFHNSDIVNNMRQMRENAVPILEDYGVDLVFTGHSHDYERTVLLDGHYGNSSTWSTDFVVDGSSGNRDKTRAYTKPTLGPAPHEGAIYTVAGSAGQISGGSLDHPAMLVALNVFATVSIDVDGPVLDVTMISETGEFLDEYRIVKGATPAPPVAAFSATPLAGNTPLTVQFADLTNEAPLEWEWDCDGDGDVDSDLQNPVFQYTVPGLYTVTQRVGNVVAFDDEIKQQLVCVVDGTPERVELLHAQQTFGWFLPNDPDPITYEMLRGRLNPLLDSAGDFASTSPECVVSGIDGFNYIDTFVPPIGEPYYYLARARDCIGAVSDLESGGTAQTGTRSTVLGTVCP